jgi:hypothetical protein
MQKYTSVIWGVISVVVLLALVWLASTRQTPIESTLTASTTPMTIADPSTLPGLQTGNAPWIAEVQNLSARLAANQLPELTMEGQVMHIHQHLDLFINGAPVAVPSEIGVNEKAGWLSQIHVHDTRGVIHVESPYKAIFTLGQFFDVWGVRFTSNAIGGYVADTERMLRVYVNGQLYEGDPRMLELAAHQQITVVYGTDTQTPTNIPAIYTFAPGE